MTEINTGGYIQDTIQQKNLVVSDTIKQLKDSSDGPSKITRGMFLVHHDITPKIKDENVIIDTASLCKRNPIADVTFYDSANVVRQIDGTIIDRFPFLFTEINSKIREENRATLVSHLKEGNQIPVGEYHLDWFVVIILASAFFYAVVRAAAGNVFRGVLRFIFFRGINEPGSRDTGALFQWESTLFNLATFMNLSLFAFLTSIHYNFSPSEIKGVRLWLIYLGIIIVAVTLRHLICMIIGKASREDEIFREYLVQIYQAYRMAGLLIFLINILVLYMTLSPVKIYFLAGLIAIGTLYLARVLRLFVIFINRHVSIFYLILYLCALEILPVVILVKYVTGLV